MHKPINPNLNASSNNAVFKGVDPISVDLGHLHTHARSVVYEIQARQAQALRLLAVERRSNRRPLKVSRAAARRLWASALTEMLEDTGNGASEGNKVGQREYERGSETPRPTRFHCQHRRRYGDKGCQRRRRKGHEHPGNQRRFHEDIATALNKKWSTEREGEQRNQAECPS